MLNHVVIVEYGSCSVMRCQCIDGGLSAAFNYQTIDREVNKI